MSVGNFMQSGRDQAIKSLVTLLGIVVYVAGVVYAEVHGYAMLSKGVNPDMLVWATLGIVALGLTALTLPLGLHYSFHAPLQKIAAYMFYMLDLALLIMNAVVDFNIESGGGAGLPAWAAMYIVWVVPATPIIAALGWSLLWTLDPSSAQRGLIEAMRVGTEQALAARIMEQAKSVDIEESVDRAAAQLARDVIQQTLGHSAGFASRRSLNPGGVINLPAKVPGVEGLPVSSVQPEKVSLPELQPVKAGPVVVSTKNGLHSPNGSGPGPMNPAG